MIWILYIFLTLLIIAMGIYGVYMIYAMLSGAPFVPTPKDRVEKMMAFADISAGDTVYDIGSGDGRIVLRAVEEGAKGIGIEINPTLYWYSRWKSRNVPQATFHRQNLWDTNLSDANVVMLYCIPDKMGRLLHKLQKELKPGTRVVSHAFTFQGGSPKRKMVQCIYTKSTDQWIQTMPFTPIGDTLDDQLKGKGPLKKQVEASQVLDFATEALVELFGEELAAHAKPLFLKNRTLTISCASSAVAQEIRLNQASIVEKINTKLGKSEVDRIRYLA